MDGRADRVLPVFAVADLSKAADSWARVNPQNFALGSSIGFMGLLLENGGSEGRLALGDVD